MFLKEVFDREKSCVFLEIFSQASSCPCLPERPLLDILLICPRALQWIIGIDYPYGSVISGCLNYNLVSDAEEIVSGKIMEVMYN